MCVCVCFGPVPRGVLSSAVLSKQIYSDSLGTSLSYHFTLQNHIPFALVSIFFYTSINKAITVAIFATYFWANRILPPMISTWVAGNTSEQIEKWQLHKTLPKSQVVCRQVPPVIMRQQKSCPEAWDNKNHHPETAGMMKTPWWPAREGWWRKVLWKEICPSWLLVSVLSF